MKKKILSLLLVAIIACSICACGGSTETNSGDDANIATSESVNENKTSVVVEKDGIICIDENKFGEIIERVELTTENWKDYIKVCSCDNVSYDKFGDIVSTDTYYYIGADTKKFYQFEEAVIELKNKETGEVTVYELGNRSEVPFMSAVTNDFNLDNYECTRIKGYLYFVDMPMEVLHSPLHGEEYETCFTIAGKGHSESYRVNANTKEIYGSVSWDSYIE